MDVNHVEAIIEILSELAFANILKKISVRGRNKPKIHCDIFVAAYTLNLARLNDAQKLDLRRKIDFRYLVQKERSAVSRLELADLEAIRSSKGTLLMAEKLRLDESRRKCGTFKRHKRPLGARRKIVERARHKLFACSRCTLHNDIRVRTCGKANKLVDLLHRRRFASKRLKALAA